MPKQTTFSTTPAKNEHPSYSPVTKLNEGNTSGNVVIMFNYENSAAKDGDKAWFDKIASEGALELVQYDQYKTVLNDHLTYTKGTTNHGGTVGTLTIPFNQDNFRNNGRYYVRVASTTADGKKSYALVPIHVVNHDAPTFAVKETPESGRNLHFSVKNMVYGITDPIEEVTLTKPDKKTVTLNKIDDYFLFSQDLFVLYNDTTAENGTNHLDQKGAYVLTIKANGFQDATCNFYVADGKEVETPVTKAMRSYGIDVISGASTNIGGSDSSSSGGGYAISADLLFDSDLLANALVLEKVGAETSAASTVLDYWKGHVVSDAVFDKGDTKYYPIGAYISAVNTAQTTGTMWIPFTSYRTGAQATASQPRATKAVLEDGLLGDIQDSSTSGKLDAITPTITGNAQGSNVVLTFTGDNAEAYLTKIENDGLVYLNGDWRELGKDKYTVDLEHNTITFQAKCFAVGKNSIRLKSAGYKVQDVTVDYSKVNENVTGLTVAQTNGVVNVAVTGSTNGDFLKNLKSITLTKDGKTDAVWTKGVEGSDAVYYVVADNYKSVDLYNVKPGTYTVSIKANYYESALATNFTVASSGDVELKPVPDSEPDVSKATNKNYQLTFRTDDSSWRDSTTITVNGVSYGKASGTVSENQFKWVMGGYGYYLELDKTAFHTDTVSTVVITADGYQTLTLKINADGTLDYGANKAAPTVSTIQSETKEAYYPGDITYYKVTLTPGEGYTAQEYLNRASKSTVTVGSKTYQWKTSLSSSWDNNGFTVMDGTLALAKDEGFSTTSGTTVTVEVPGYETLTFVVDKDGNLVTGGNSGENPGSGETPGSGDEDISVPTTVNISKERLSSGTDYHMLSFGGSGAWLDKVTKVKVGNDFYNESSNLGTKMWNKDITNNTVSIMFPSELWSTTYAVTFMTDEEGVLLKLSVVIPGFSGTPTVEITE